MEEMLDSDVKDKFGYIGKTYYNLAVDKHNRLLDDALKVQNESNLGTTRPIETLGGEDE